MDHHVLLLYKRTEHMKPFLVLETKNYKLYNDNNTYKLFKNKLHVLDFNCEIKDVFNFLSDCDPELSAETKKYQKFL